MPSITIITKRGKSWAFGAFLFYFIEIFKKITLRHLNGCILDSISKPTLLITDSYNFLHNPVKRRTRDEKLLGFIFLKFLFIYRKKFN